MNSTESRVQREMRWFRPGAMPEAARAWYASLPGDNIRTAFPRQDIFLVVPERSDLGLKVREGRMEIKTREKPGNHYKLLAGRMEGLTEDWKKYTWNYLDQIGEISAPFEKGIRSRIVKSRVQRKYAVEGKDVVPVPFREKPELTFVLEMADLFTQPLHKSRLRGEPRHWWSFGFEAVAVESAIDEVFDKATTALLADYPEPALGLADSYGYPKFAMNVAAELDR